MRHVHRLAENEHKAFLAEGRLDPLTREPLRPGDQIIICAQCRSAFLMASWDAIENQHCNQRDTLAVLSDATIRVHRINRRTRGRQGGHPTGANQWQWVKIAIVGTLLLACGLRFSLRNDDLWSSEPSMPALVGSEPVHFSTPRHRPASSIDVETAAAVIPQSPQLQDEDEDVVLNTSEGDHVRVQSTTTFRCTTFLPPNRTVGLSLDKGGNCYDSIGLVIRRRQITSNLLRKGRAHVKMP